VKITALHHVNINVSDLDTSIGFYTGVLGLNMRKDRPVEPPGAWLNVGGQQLHLSVGEPPEPNGQHFAVEVDDIDDLARRLHEAGIEVEKVGSGDPVQIVVSDPSGNRIELRGPRRATGPG
jgi:glyoxylase I family protein